MTSNWDQAVKLSAHDKQLIEAVRAIIAAGEPLHGRILTVREIIAELQGKA